VHPNTDFQQRYAFTLFFPGINERSSPRAVLAMMLPASGSLAIMAPSCSSEGARSAFDGAAPRDGF